MRMEVVAKTGEAAIDTVAEVEAAAVVETAEIAMA